MVYLKRSDIKMTKGKLYVHGEYVGTIAKDHETVHGLPVKGPGGKLLGWGGTAYHRFYKVELVNGEKFEADTVKDAGSIAYNKLNK